MLRITLDIPKHQQLPSLNPLEAPASVNRSSQGSCAERLQHSRHSKAAPRRGTINESLLGAEMDFGLGPPGAPGQGSHRTGELKERSISSPAERGEGSISVCLPAGNWAELSLHVAI